MKEWVCGCPHMRGDSLLKKVFPLAIMPILSLDFLPLYRPAVSLGLDEQFSLSPSVAVSLSVRLLLARGRLWE